MMTVKETKSVETLLTWLQSVTVGLVPLLVALTDLQPLTKIILATVWLSFHWTVQLIACAIQQVYVTTYQAQHYERITSLALLLKFENEKEVGEQMAKNAKTQKFQDIADLTDPTPFYFAVYQCAIYLVFAVLFFLIMAYSHEILLYLRGTEG